MGDFIIVIVVSAILALATAALSCLIVLKRYKTKLQSPIYPLDKYTNMTLSHRSDLFAGRTVTKVRVSSPKRSK